MPVQTEQQVEITACNITADNLVYNSFSGATIHYLNVVDGVCSCMCARDGTIVEIKTVAGHHIKVAFCNECHLQVIPRDERCI